MIIDFIYFQLLIVILLVMLFASMFRILREYERGVVFLLGRFHKVKGPGFIILIPWCSKWCGWICAL
ncbi:hypothetical protein MBH78_17315 [Oceanimonas sp. NS1]|nr:hypothetical protein [Oceanimonas sp. NS1]